MGQVYNNDIHVLKKKTKNPPMTYLEESTATHSSILAWRVPWTEEPGGYSPWGRKEMDTTERLTHTHTTQLARSACPVSQAPAAPPDIHIR